MTYHAENGLVVTAVELNKPATNESTEASLYVHFLSDGKSAFVATATVMPQASKELVFEHTYKILQTALITEAPPVTEKVSGYPSSLIGTWVAEDVLSDGKRLISKSEIKADSTFSTIALANENIIFAATGTWSVQGDQLLWTYLYSKPELPSGMREDKDTVVSAEQSQLTLKSYRTGVVHIFKRSQ